jgi:glycosidase
LDQHDPFDGSGSVSQEGGKQVDPVNFSRLADDWRRDVKDCVARLIALRTSNPALACNGVDFIHVDFNDNKRVLVWRRGGPGSGDQVIVVANFSDYASPGGLSGEYVFPNWPGVPAGKAWREATRSRPAPRAASRSSRGKRRCTSWWRPPTPEQP